MNRLLCTTLLTLSAGVALLLLSPPPASAVMVTIGATDYDVTVFVGTQSANAALFQGPPAGKMPWWGDTTGTIASQFATEVGSQLGAGPNSGFGPVFAYDLGVNGIDGVIQKLMDPNSQMDVTVSINDSVKYAIATPLIPVPAPLPIVGGAMAFGWSRKLRQRLATRQQ